jgi:acetyl-CoA acyltransferase
MREAVVVASSRTPLAKSQRGSFNMTLPSDLAAHCITDALGKVPQLDPKEVEDVVLGCGQPHGSQGHNIARVAAMRAGLPVSVAGLTINRFCSSGLNAIAIAAGYIINEGADVVFGGGVESITMMQRDNAPNPWVKERVPGIYMVMGDTAEVVAKRYKIGRQAQDEYALLSQQRTARAQQEGFFKEELAPMHVTRAVLDRKTGEKTGEEPYYVEKDECNRADTTLEGLLSLPPHFDKTSGQGTVTAGNSRSCRTAPPPPSSCRWTAQRPSGSSRSSSSAASRSRAASRTRWVSARSMRCRSCSSATGCRSTTSTCGS